MNNCTFTKHLALLLCVQIAPANGWKPVMWPMWPHLVPPCCAILHTEESHLNQNRIWPFSLEQKHCSRQRQRWCDQCDPIQLGTARCHCATIVRGIVLLGGIHPDQEEEERRQQAARVLSHQGRNLSLMGVQSYNGPRALNQRKKSLGSHVGRSPQICTVRDSVTSQKILFSLQF